MEMTTMNSINFDLPKNRSNLIKVIGVGGGGSNAINYMFSQGIKGVDFVVCNTDSQALNESPVPIKIQLGATLTEGLGAGANPEVGARAAQESSEVLQSLLNTQTKMVFITAGMGGGTGTGAAPLIAKMAKQMEILTVGIVTMPFQFEGKLRTTQAQTGLENMRKSVDALIVVNNNKLREVYGNLGYKTGFAKADEVLSKAARGIAEVISYHYTQNIDLKDAKTVLTDSGTAIMGSATAVGANRSQEAIVKALDSPLLNDNKITGCKNVLLLIVSGKEEITIDEIGEINDHIQSEAGNNANIIMGMGEDEKLGEAIAVTIIATGFGIEQQDDIVNTEAKKIIHTLEDGQKMEHDLMSKEDSVSMPFSDDFNSEERLPQAEEDFEIPIAEAEDDCTSSEEENPLIPTNEMIAAMDVVYEIIQPETSHSHLETDLKNLEEIEETEKEEISTEMEPNEFVIHEVASEDSEKSEEAEEIDTAQTQFEFDFDMPLKKENPIEKEEPESKPPVYREDVVDAFVEDPVRFELREDATEPTSTSEEDQMQKIDKKEVSKKNEPVMNEKENPFDKKISDSSNEKNGEKRLNQLNMFSQQFNNQRVEDLEKQPAYKRMGLDLEEDPTDAPISRMTLDNDANDDMQLRSNNSFLHDNVD